MPRKIGKQYIELAKSLLAKEGKVDDDRAHQLAIMLRDVRALDKPHTAKQGVIIVVYHEDEFGDVNANVQYEFYDGKGKEGTPSAELATWLMEMATDTLADNLPSEDDIQ